MHKHKYTLVLVYLLIHNMNSHAALQALNGEEHTSANVSFTFYFLTMLLLI